MIRLRFIVLSLLLVMGGLLLAQNQALSDQLTDQWAVANTIEATSVERNNANKAFITMLAQALVQDEDLSIDFSSSLPGMFVVYPPDTSFRMLTWELLVTDNHVRHFGVIQQKDNPKRLLPLFDASDRHFYRTKDVLSRDEWFGQIYYDLSPVEGSNGGRYLLLGYDRKDSLSDFKILDVLVFSEGEAFFGAPLFACPPDMPIVAEGDVISHGSLTTRLFFEYKEGTIVRLSVEKPSNNITYSHLSPIHPSAKETLYNYVPDGTDAGYRWNGDHWEWIPDPSAILPTD